MPDPVDVHIGARLLQRRKELGLTPAAGSRLIGVSQTQIGKYEDGSTRISVERLYRFAALLDVEVGYFYAGLPYVEDKTTTRPASWSVLQAASSIEAIENLAIKRSLLELIGLVEAGQS